MSDYISPVLTQAEIFAKLESARDEIVILTVKIKELENLANARGLQVGQLSGYNRNLYDLNVKQDETIVRLREALSEFGTHTPLCNSREMHEGVMRMGLNCDCGLDESLEKLK